MKRPRTSESNSRQSEPTLKREKPRFLGAFRTGDGQAISGFVELRNFAAHL